MFGSNYFGEPYFADGYAGFIPKPKVSPVRIANSNVGPMALRRTFRQPYYPNVTSRANVSQLTATLTFTGAQTKQTAYPLTGGLSFTGVFTKITNIPLVAAVLSFTGAFSKKDLKALTGGLSFTGVFSKMDLKALTGTLSFTGTFNKLTKYFMTGVLSFTGAMVKTTKYFFNATLSFTTLFAIPAIYVVMTAGLSFSGAIGRNTRKSMTSTLTFSGLFGRGFKKTFTAALNFIGSFVHSANTAATGTLWMQNPTYLQGAVQYDDSNTLFDANVPFDGAVTANITSVYPQTAQLWAPYFPDAKQTIWNQNPTFMQGTVGYDDSNTLFDAAIPFDGAPTKNLTTVYAPPDTIYSEDSFI
jgi:hypothetical protein